MTDLWQFIGLVGATVIYAVMLVVALHSLGIYPFVPVFARLKKRHAEDVLLVIFVFGAICADRTPLLFQVRTRRLYTAMEVLKLLSTKMVLSLRRCRNRKEYSQ